MVVTYGISDCVAAQSAIERRDGTWLAKKDTCYRAKCDVRYVQRVSTENTPTKLVCQRTVEVMTTGIEIVRI